MSGQVGVANLARLLKSDLDRWWNHSHVSIGFAYVVGELDPCGVVLHFHGSGQTFTVRINEGLDEGLLLYPELPFPTGDG